jgi:HlyD family secretion protein
MSTQRILPLFIVVGTSTLALSIWLSCGEAVETPAKQETIPPTSERVVAEGRIVTYPGAQMEIGSEAGGLITLLPIEENTLVQKGSLVAELKADDLRASLREAQARVEELDAEQKLAESEKTRHGKLATDGAVSEQDEQRVERDLAVVRARRAAAVASLDRIEAELAKTRIIAPFTGTILKRRVEPGEVINPHTAIATLADLTRVRIDAEVDEYDASRVHKGASVRVTAEGHPNESWQGIVEEVPPVVVTKGMVPRDPSLPVDVRVLRAKIALTGPTPLKLGQRVELEVDAPKTSLVNR